MNVTAPPVVSSYDDLVALRARLASAIIIAIDLENVDHVRSLLVLPKLSEVGVACIDMTSLPRAIEDCSMDDTTPQLDAVHWIVNKWKCITEDTCPARWHLREDEHGRCKGHTARPYHCQFAESEIARTPFAAIESAGKYIASFDTTGSESDDTDATERQIIVLFWAASLEQKTIEESGIHNWLPKSCKFWDLQKWSLACRLASRCGKSQAACKDSLGSLGLPDSIGLHNATNDAVAEVLSFLRVLQITADELVQWREGARLSTTIDMDYATWNGKNEEVNRNLGRQVLEDRERARANRTGRGGPARFQGRGFVTIGRAWA